MGGFGGFGGFNQRGGKPEGFEDMFSNFEDLFNMGGG